MFHLGDLALCYSYYYYLLVSRFTHTQAVHPHFAAALGMSGIRGTRSAYGDE
jgi:hypothetical protein